MMTPYIQKKGFTLLEMTMVLAIVSLVMGAILVGRTMIRQSQLQQVVSEVAQYKQAVVDFRNKYLALPGDFTGATALWGSADGVTPSDSTCQTTLGTGTQTCDGDGDGRITTQSADTTAMQYEQFRAWQHLSNAGFISGNYTGKAGTADPQQAIIGTNVPTSRLTGAGYGLFSLTSAEAAAGTEYPSHYFSSINYRHMLQFGAAPTATVVSDYSTVWPVLTPREALALDSKMDDGMPGTGSIIAEQKNSPYSPNCADSNTASTAKYYTAQSTQNCSLSFLLGF